MQGTSTCRWQCLSSPAPVCALVQVRSASLHGWAGWQARDDDGKVLSGASWPPETRVLWWTFTLRGFLFLYPHTPFFWLARKEALVGRSQQGLVVSTGWHAPDNSSNNLFRQKSEETCSETWNCSCMSNATGLPPADHHPYTPVAILFFHLLPLTSWIMGFIVWIICFSLCSRKRLEQQLAKLAGRSVWAGIHNCPLSALCRLRIILDGSILADAWQTRVWYSFTPSSFVLGGGLFYNLPTETIIFSRRRQREDSCLAVGSTPWGSFLLGSWLGGFLAGGFTLTGFIGCRAFVLRFLGLNLGEEKKGGPNLGQKRKPATNVNLGLRCRNMLWRYILLPPPPTVFTFTPSVFFFFFF